MAPSRRKGAGKASAAAAARRQWKVGDLVLAKVKGFPAWPATVSEPEKWGYSADWKKVLVYFFGTQQIAFCNPADVEAFTEEKKQSLLTKRHAKGSDFVRAVKEIIESYEKLEQQKLADEQKEAEGVNLASGENTVEPSQVGENPTGAGPETQLNSDSSQGKDESTLLSEDASAAEQMLALRDNGLAREQACDSGVVKEPPKIATYSSRKRNGGARSQKCAPHKKGLSVQHSKNSSKLESDKPQNSMLECKDRGQTVDDMDDGSLRRRKRIRRSADHSESDVVGSSALNSNGTDDENASEIATVESGYNIRNESNGVDSSSKVEHSDAGGHCHQGDYEVSKGLDFQINTKVVRKKRKPNRKRVTSDVLDRPAKVEAEAVSGQGGCNNYQTSQNLRESLNERPSEEKGDEHLPLVKRARVRMSRTFYADDEANGSLQVDEISFKDTGVDAAVHASPSSNHENENVSAGEECKSLEVSAEKNHENELSGDTFDVVPSSEKTPSESNPPSKSCEQIVGDKQSPLEFRWCETSKSSDDEAAQMQSKQFRSSPDGEALTASAADIVQEFPGAEQSKSDHPVVENLLHNDETEAPLGIDSATLFVAKYGCSRLDITASELPAHSADQQQSQDQNSCGHLIISSGDSSNHKNDENSGHVVQSETVISCGLDITGSELPAHSADEQQSQDQNSCSHSLVSSGDSPNDKNDVSILHAVKSETVDHSPSSLIMVNKQEVEKTPLKEEHGSPAKELDSGKQTHTSLNPVIESNKSVGEAQPQYETETGFENAVANHRQLEKLCSSEIEEERKEQVQTAHSVSLSENFSCEKMSLSPANIADSPVRGTPHSSSVCHISTAESANVTQNNGSCSPNVHSNEKKLPGDQSIHEREKIETEVSQGNKVVDSDVQSSLESFESALGSLVRTKESIGRATRLAMDLVRFGVSMKAMEVLAHTLESESNLERRVDLFFLVDSIAQCSKGLKGDAGGVYLSAIQSLLPRLLAAAAPAGATTQENRKQCLKVLRLWLDRRILPDSTVRHHIRELDSHNVVPACLYSRRSARTERALDDPVRDMEGMLVDEYGSNSTLQLPGFCMPAMLKDDDEGSDSDGEDFEAVTPEHESRIPENHVTISTAERHTRVLEDVDGELEMEDVAPSWEAGSITFADQADNVESSSSRLGQQFQPVSGASPPLPSSPPPPPPPAPPSHHAQCAMSDSYSNGYPSIQGDHQGGPSRMNQSMPANTMHYQGPDSSYNSFDERNSVPPQGEGSNFAQRPFPLPPPPPPHQYSYPQPGHHLKSRRDGPPFSHRSHYMPSFDERNFHEGHERMRAGPYDSRENWRCPPPSSYGPRYHDRHKGPYPAGSYSGGSPRESGRFQNHRWNYNPRPYNNRHSFHYKPHSDGPVPVGMRDEGMWHQR